jgi:uncharacterized protein (TIGR02271 family)
MLNTQDPGSLIGATVIDSDGDKIGTVGQIYLDAESGAPKWASVHTGLFGMSESFVPIDQADDTADGLRVAYQKDVVKNAPRIDADGSIDESEENALYSYYGNEGVDRGVDTATTTGYDTSGPTTDDAMTRSEERLHVGTETVQTGRARLRKYVVTEQQSVTVPVSHEEVRLEREPITDANVGDALAGPEISEEEHEVILTAERPVVAKETVPVERVRLDTETVTEETRVSEQVRKEEIELEDGTTSLDGDATRR